MVSFSTRTAAFALCLIGNNFFLPLFSGQQAVAADPFTSSANFLNSPPDESISCELPSPPDVASVRQCIHQYKDDWDRTYKLVKKKQVELISKRNAASVLQWIGVSGVATAAALGLSDSGKNHTVAIVVGSASALSGLLGTFWKTEAIERREAACEAILQLEPTFKAKFAGWEQDADNPEFRKTFSQLTKTDYFNLLIDNLGKCAPTRARINTFAKIPKPAF